MSHNSNPSLVHRTLPKYNSEKWLEKYGWERGKGLGKEEQGRLDFVKVSKKDNTTGLGKPSYEVKDFHWWDNVYTQAAQSVKIETADGEVKIETKSETTETRSVYGGLFVSGGTMEDERKKLEAKSKVTTESELFAVCGNRDLRKFKQDGKAARLASHDSEMKEHIELHKKKRIDGIYKDVTDAEKKAEEKAEKKKAKKEKEKRKEANKMSAARKKKRKREEMEAQSDSSDSSDSSDAESEKKKSKKKNKKSKTS